MIRTHVSCGCVLFWFGCYELVRKKKKKWDFSLVFWHVHTIFHDSIKRNKHVRFNFSGKAPEWIKIYIFFDFSRWSCQLSWISNKSMHVNVMFVLKLFFCVLEKLKMQITNLNDYVKKKKKDCGTCLNWSSDLFLSLNVFTVFFIASFALKSFTMLENVSVHFSLVATGLSRLRLQSKNYLFTQSSSAGDLPMVICSLSFVYCFDRHVQICFSTSVIPRVWYYVKTQQSVNVSCSCSISASKFSFELLANFV